VRMIWGFDALDFNGGMRQMVGSCVGFAVVGLSVVGVNVGLSVVGWNVGCFVGRLGWILVANLVKIESCFRSSSSNEGEEGAEGEEDVLEMEKKMRKVKRQKRRMEVMEYRAKFDVGLGVEAEGVRLNSAHRDDIGWLCFGANL
jgi:hypothetical protein